MARMFGLLAVFRFISSVQEHFRQCTKYQTVVQYLVSLSVAVRMLNAPVDGVAVCIAVTLTLPRPWFECSCQSQVS